VLPLTFPVFPSLPRLSLSLEVDPLNPAVSSPAEIGFWCLALCMYFLFFRCYHYLVNKDVYNIYIYIYGSNNFKDFNENQLTKFRTETIT